MHHTQAIQDSRMECVDQNLSSYTELNMLDISTDMWEATGRIALGDEMYLPTQYPSVPGNHQIPLPPDFGYPVWQPHAAALPCGVTAMSTTETGKSNLNALTCPAPYHEKEPQTWAPTRGDRDHSCDASEVLPEAKKKRLSPHVERTDGRSRKDKGPRLQGQNKYGRLGTLRCSLCRQHRKKVYRFWCSDQWFSVFLRTQGKVANIVVERGCYVQKSCLRQTLP